MDELRLEKIKARKQELISDIRKRITALELLDHDNNWQIVSIAEYRRILNTINVEVAEAIKKYNDYYSDYSTLMDEVEKQLSTYDEYSQTLDEDEFELEDFE